MADFGVGEFLLAIFGAESIGTFIWGLFTEVCEFLGEEGSWLMLEIVPNLRFAGIEIIYDAAVLDADGVVSGFGPQIVKIANVDVNKLLRFVQIISTKMKENGIAWLSTTGKEFFTAFMQKLNEYKEHLTIGAASAIANGLLLKYTSQGKTPEDKRIDKEPLIPFPMR